MKTVYKYTLSIEPKALSDTAIKHVPHGIVDAAEIAVSSRPMLCLSGALESCFELLNAYVAMLDDPDGYFSLVHVNPIYQSIDKALGEDAVANEETIEEFELNSLKFNPGEVMRIWGFRDTDDPESIQDSIVYATFRLINVPEEPVEIQ